MEQRVINDVPIVEKNHTQLGTWKQRQQHLL